MKFVVKWEEWVYDAFDEIESINPQRPLEIEAESIDEAIDLGRLQANEIIHLQRPDWSHGEFIAKILTLYSDDGSHYQIQPPHKIIDYSIIGVED